MTFPRLCPPLIISHLVLFAHLVFFPPQSRGFSASPSTAEIYYFTLFEPRQSKWCLGSNQDLNPGLSVGYEATVLTTHPPFSPIKSRI